MVKIMIIKPEPAEIMTDILNNPQYVGAVYYCSNTLLCRIYWVHPVWGLFRMSVIISAGSGLIIIIFTMSMTLGRNFSTAPHGRAAFLGNSIDSLEETTNPNRTKT